MEIKIRPAKEEDIEILLEFEKGIIETERPFDITLKDEEIHYYDLLELVRSPESEVVVAEINGQPVGSGYAQIRKADPFQAYAFRLPGFYVCEAGLQRQRDQPIATGSADKLGENKRYF